MVEERVDCLTTPDDDLDTASTSPVAEVQEQVAVTVAIEPLLWFLEYRRDDIDLAVAAATKFIEAAPIQDSPLELPGQRREAIDGQTGGSRRRERCRLHAWVDTARKPPELGERRAPIRWVAGDTYELLKEPAKVW
jgi:hypothetical protein